jgi:hypothetical protein
MRQNASLTDIVFSDIFEHGGVEHGGGFLRMMNKSD